MYFCPKCNYSFDISKSYGSEVNEEKKNLKKVTDAIKVFESGENLKNYKAEFIEEDLEKNIKYKKLSDEDKEKFNYLFQTNVITGAQFKCNNCSFTKEITESVLLYQYDTIDRINKIKNIQDNELITKNPILPRTHDYICKNISCTTNKNSKNIKKEAVFFRDRDSFKVNYICCVCYYNW
jgi:hypothetical protein